jgi:hypothetical protein
VEALIIPAYWRVVGGDPSATSVSKQRCLRAHTLGQAGTIAGAHGQQAASQTTGEGVALGTGAEAIVEARGQRLGLVRGKELGEGEKPERVEVIALLGAEAHRRGGRR